MLANHAGAYRVVKGQQCLSPQVLLMRDLKPSSNLVADSCATRGRLKEALECDP